MVDTATGEPLLWPEEEAAARKAAEKQDRALQAELDRLRRDRDG
jgi:hypothetical protein